MSEAATVPVDDLPTCAVCKADLDWVECWDCGGERAYHDCGEDVCCCAEPEPNRRCDSCDGKGGWWVCQRAEWHLVEPVVVSP
jgi:hypothetical protein